MCDSADNLKQIVDRIFDSHELIPEKDKDKEPTNLQLSPDLAEVRTSGIEDDSRKIQWCFYWKCQRFFNEKSIIIGYIRLEWLQADADQGERRRSVRAKRDKPGDV